MTEEQRASHNLQRARYQEKQNKEATKRDTKKAMTAEQRTIYNLQRARSKAGMSRYNVPESGGAFECIKCGFHTDRDRCPECGRPCW